MTAAKAEPEDLDTAVRRASEGDKKAIAAIRENVMPLVLRYISARAGKPGAESERLAEEVWTRIATALPAYEGTGRPFMAFVYGIAAHSVAEDQRHATAERSGGATDQTTESARQMNDLLATLPAKHREILILRLVVGMTAEETAAAVGSTPGAVRVAQKRAITKLKRTVEEGNASKRTGSVQ
ncbi:sigma-70 family RNA polymerase sigma factor [Rhodococcus sp. ACS1]|uniref:sigma-70 family RNA polymerase sigma factor n=1 Tax=Rhodococcus sp. ACS1 TaxID=2028570 RepID=UPI00211C7DD4|nr:sigma-70 family RNA polymerase sigma factor [Rhodococcus sp. ACS1]